MSYDRKKLVVVGKAIVGKSMTMKNMVVKEI